MVLLGVSGVEAGRCWRMLAGVTGDDEHWTTAVACGGDDRFTGDDASEPVVEALQAVCRTCPVRVDCDAFADDVEAVWGMWAGSWRTPRTPAAVRRTAA